MPTLTDDLGQWAALVGILLPLLVALLQRDHWGDTVNAIIFGVAVVVASVIYELLKDGGWDWSKWVSALLAITTWAIATFKLYWKPSQMVTKARAIPQTPNQNSP